MLTRAYDTIMACLQTPAFVGNNTDFNTSSVLDNLLNCKSANGAVTHPMGPGGYTTTAHTSYQIPSPSIPFSYWNISNVSSITNVAMGSSLLPDEDSSTPAYEDYAFATSEMSGWTLASAKYAIEKVYDEETKEFVCSATIMWQNTSGASKTVYGTKVRVFFPYRSSYNSGGTSSYRDFIVCREHFAAPVEVPDQSILSLTFTWRVGRAGLVAATAASAFA